MAIRKSPGSGRLGVARQSAEQRLAQVVDPLARRRRRPHDRLAFQEGPRDQGPHVVLDQVQPGRLGQVALGQDHQAPGQAQEAEDLQVLARLRHHRVVGRDDQHRQVEPRGPRQHVADEPLVPRHVDQRQVGLAQLQGGEAQVDRDPPLLLGRQPVGVDPRQGADQGRLAVVDVARRSEDKVMRPGHFESSIDGGKAPGDSPVYPDPRPLATAHQGHGRPRRVAEDDSMRRVLSGTSDRAPGF